MSDQWIGLDAAFAELEQECTEIIRGMTVKIFNGFLSKTPQFLGRMAASWTYSLGSPVYIDRSPLIDPAGGEQNERYYTDLASFNGRYRGHPLAIAVANTANLGNDSGFKLGMTVYISNGVNHGEGPYSQDIEDGNINLRAENRPGAPVRRTLDWASVAYKDVSPTSARTLKTLRIGKNESSRDS